MFNLFFVFFTKEQKTANHTNICKVFFSFYGTKKKGQKYKKNKQPETCMPNISTWNPNWFYSAQI